MERIAMTAPTITKPPAGRRKSSSSRPAPGRARHAKAVTTPGPFSLTVDISRRFDATRKAYTDGVLDKGEWETRRRALERELNAAVQAELEHIGSLGPLGVTIGTTVVVSGELIEAAWGNQVRADLLALNTGKAELSGATFTGAPQWASDPTANNHLARKAYVDLFALKSGDTFTGTIIAISTGTSIRLRRSDGSNTPLIDFFDNTNTTRYGYIMGTAGDMRIMSENDLILYSSATERARIVGTAILFGKTSSDLNSAGTEIYGGGSGTLGSVRATSTVAGIQQFYGRHMSSADADTEKFASWTRSSAGTVIGSIAQVSTTGVSYATTSTKKGKVDAGAIPDAVGMLAAMGPRMATFKAGPRGAKAEPVWYAEDVAKVLPAAVVPERRLTAADVKARGYGKVGDIEPAMMDYGRPTPIIAAAVLELAERVARLEKAGAK